MIRQMIKINEDKCNGCGLCVSACHEGAIGIVDGKAKLLREDYCDGLGNCLPVCPTGAITFEERETLPFDENAVKKNMEEAKETFKGCPGTRLKSIKNDTGANNNIEDSFAKTHLNQWPIQIKLVPPNAPYFDNANLLIAADCTAFSYGNFHNEFMKNKITLIGCSKLDDIDYSEKLTAILKMNTIKSLTVVRMEVPCCSGIVNAVKTALRNSDKLIPWQVIVISTDGQIIEN
ncbi:4Fe-4S binding protein [Herbivorax sp. ANBcel31]|uniref:ATP-binding protein n=1 Tax=Herbivorax sp. ANBcel31 TaxID=3069754 RepID=UPI0027AF07A3|nr:4Fe-4S binding protein [Herbivorax sp. ANBcel31]MDQ2085587.1 4Fe-4S binding protein [Herbivorax sp. ANBcel31]